MGSCVLCYSRHIHLFVFVGLVYIDNVFILFTGTTAVFFVDTIIVFFFSFFYYLYYIFLLVVSNYYIDRFVVSHFIRLSLYIASCCYHKCIWVVSFGAVKDLARFLICHICDRASIYNCDIIGLAKWDYLIARFF